MSEVSKIEWTDATWNPWLGCSKVSPACTNCYAESWAKRSGLVKWGDNAERRRTSASYWKQPLKWNEEAKRTGTSKKVFCASLSDVFEDRSEVKPWRNELFEMIEKTPHLTWQLLTKRPENVLRMIQRLPSNVWIGTTVENQETANKRIPELLMVPAKVRFLSCEPLLESIDLIQALDVAIEINGEMEVPVISPSDFLHWVIAGTESGAQAREYHIDCFKSLRDQCAAFEIPFFMKQLTSKGKKIPFEGWPQDLQIREYPKLKEHTYV